MPLAQLRLHFHARVPGGPQLHTETLADHKSQPNSLRIQHVAHPCVQLAEFLEQFLLILLFYADSGVGNAHLHDICGRMAGL